MIFNHERQTPRDWDDANASLCPECGAELVAKRGDLVRWHWAHKASGGRCSTCSMATAPETEWHLRWKYAYASCPGWRAEHPVASGCLSYRIDAAKPHGKLAREFVHTLDERNGGKWIDLPLWGWRVLWIFDGEVFSAARRKDVASGGIKHLLKPNARRHHRILSKTPRFTVDGGDSAALVHFEGQLWREWRDDVWFPADGDAALAMLRKFAEVDL